MKNMESFADYPSEYIQPYLMGIGLLERSRIYLIGSQESSFAKYWDLVIIIPCSLGFALTLMLYFFKLIVETADLVKIANTLPIVFVVIQGILKAIVIVQNKRKIFDLIDGLSKLWPKDHDLSENQIIIKNMHLKRLGICNNVFYWCNIGGSWQYMLTPLAEILLRKVLWQEDAALVLPFGGVFPFEPVESWLRYLLVYAFQIFGILQLVYCLLGPELLIITLCAHQSTLFTLLRDDLFKINPIGSNGDRVTSREHVDGRLSSIIRRHQNLIMFSKTSDDIFNKIIFVNLLFATITTCFFALLAKLAEGPAELAKNFVGIVATIMPIFNLCYYGQLLIDASMGLNDSAYFNIWYQQDVKYQKTLLFFMTRCRQPCFLTSLRYAPVALTSFTTVMSTTWSYFSLASSFINDK